MLRKNFVAALSLWLIASICQADSLQEAQRREDTAQSAVSAAKAEQTKANVAFGSAEAADKAAKAELKKAQEEHELLVATAGAGPSKLKKAQDELEAAAAAVKAANLITATSAGDRLKTSRLAKAEVELAKLSKEAGELRARVKRLNAARFEEIIPATVESILTETLDAAKTLEAKTKTDLAEKQTAKDEADKVVAAAEKALKQAQDEVRAEKGLNEAKNLRETLDTRLGNLEKKIDEGFSALERTLDKHLAGLLVQAGKIGTASTEEAEDLHKLLDHFTSQAQSGKAVASKLDRLIQILETQRAGRPTTPSYYDPCRKCWMVASR